MNSLLPLFLMFNNLLSRETLPAITEIPSLFLCGVLLFGRLAQAEASGSLRRFARARSKNEKTRDVREFSEYCGMLRTP